MIKHRDKVLVWVFGFSSFINLGQFSNVQLTDLVINSFEEQQKLKQCEIYDNKIKVVYQSLKSQSFNQVNIAIEIIQIPNYLTDRVKFIQIHFETALQSKLQIELQIEAQIIQQMQLLKNAQHSETKKSSLLTKTKQTKLSLSFIDIKHKITKTSSNRQAQNFTTHDNSLAKNDKVSKSMIQTEGSNRSYSREKQHSQSKRKKFISMTQRKNQNHSEFSQQLNNSQRKLHNVSKFQSDTKINVLHSHEASAPTSLRQYLRALVSKISPLTKIQTEQPSSENKQEKIMNEDVCPYQKQSQTVEKVKLEKNRISKLFQTDRHRKIKTQIEMEESFHVQNHKRLTTQIQYPFASRNMMIFEQKIGHNTLTRKDSLILMLTEGSDLVQQNLWQSQSAIKFRNQNIQVQLSQSQNTKSSQKQCKSKPLKELQLKSLAQEKINQKPSKIKFISLIQRQQSYRYRNNLSNNELKDQFINLKSKIQKKKSSD